MRDSLQASGVEGGTIRVPMRKLSDIVRRPSILGLSKDDSLVIVEYTVETSGRNSIDLIARLYREIGYPGSIVPTNLAHISGATEERLVFVSVWRNERDADAAFALVKEAVDKLAEEIDSEITIHRASFKAQRVIVGPQIEDYDARVATVNPDCVAFTIDIPVDGRQIYDHYCAAMRFPEEVPDGLLLHLAYEVNDELRTISVWQSIEHSRDFMRDRIIPAGPEVVRDHGVFPEVRPVEFKPTLLAFNLGEDQAPR